MLGRFATMAVILTAGIVLGALATGSRDPDNNGLDQRATTATPPGVSEPMPSTSGAITVEPALISDQDALAEILALVNREIVERKRLEESVGHLREDVVSLTERLEAATISANTNSPPLVNALPDDRNTERTQHIVDESSFIAAGFDTAQAADLKKRLDETQLQRLYLRDRARREKWLGTPRYTEAVAELDEALTSLKQELGEQDYDRYLFATGQTNRVSVESVMAGSAAQDVDLRFGDTIMRYDGQRIFSWSDLTSQIFEGEAGEIIGLEIERDGKTIEVFVPRGPLGIRLGESRANPSDTAIP